MGGKSQTIEDNSADDVVVPQPAQSIYTPYPESIPSYQGGPQPYQSPQMFDTIPNQLSTINDQLSQAYDMGPQGVHASNALPPSTGLLATDSILGTPSEGLKDQFGNDLLLNANADGNMVIPGSMESTKLAYQPAGILNIPQVFADPGGASGDDMQNAINILSESNWFGTQ